MNSMLVMIHLGSNSGYAVGSLETVFFRMAERLVGSQDRVHFSYANLSGGVPTSLPAGFSNVIAFDSRDGSPKQRTFIREYLRVHQIDLVFGFDLPVHRPVYGALRAAGVRTLISYYGAPTSSLNRGIKLLLKRVEVALRTNRPDHFIFESEAMRETAVYGRGIPRRDTSVVHLGVDTERFSPGRVTSHYAHDQFGIPHGRRIVFYSGHIQERKGVDVLLRAASEIVDGRGRRDVHFLLVGNRHGEEKDYRYLYEGTGAESHITFGGYRNDVPRLLPSCFLGVIPSTGWDSFTMSSLEMAACGLPLLASRLQGLVEAVEDGRTGYLSEPGDHSALADRIEQLLDDPAKYASFSQAARARIEHGFSLEHQLQGLVNAVRSIAANG